MQTAEDGQNQIFKLGVALSHHPDLGGPRFESRKTQPARLASHLDLL